MANSGINLEIISPEGLILKDTVNEVVLPTTSGEIAVLPGHTPLFTRLSEGEILVRKGPEETFVAITGGFLEIIDDTMNVLADFAIRSDDIEKAKVEQARQRAEEIVKERQQKKDLLLAEKELKKTILELKIADKVAKRYRKST